MQAGSKTFRFVSSRSCVLLLNLISSFIARFQTNEMQFSDFFCADLSQWLLRSFKAPWRRPTARENRRNAINRTRALHKFNFSNFRFNFIRHNNCEIKIRRKGLEMTQEIDYEWTFLSLFAFSPVWRVSIHGEEDSITDKFAVER